MKMTGNCKSVSLMDCPYLVWPEYHSGFTGKSGPETWWHCKKHNQAIRHIYFCELSGNSSLWKLIYHDKR
jgi:hypothetical protein